MYEKSIVLQELFEKYDIENLPFGKKQDKLGDVMEDYCAILLSDPCMLRKIKMNDCQLDNIDDYLCWSILKKADVDVTDVVSMKATRDVEHRWTGGNAKTDVILTIKYSTETVEIPISVKQTTVAKVAMAEFDAETIFSEIGITDPIVKRLVLKHQIDASAINFTTEEKALLTEHLDPYARDFVRWVLTGTAKPTCDLRYPKIMVKFDMSRDDEVNDVVVFDIDDYVDSVMYNKNGVRKSGGFGTGLGWTYATGSKGKKIQFKG